MKLLKYGIGGLLGLVLLAVLVSFALPSDYHVARSTTINASPEAVWPHVNSLKAWKAWMPWIRKDPDMTINYEGPEAGVGSKSAWKSETEGSGEMTITRSEPHALVHYDLYFPDWDSTSVGKMILEPVDGGTKVTWSDEGDMGMNPMGKFFLLFLDDMLGKDFESGLANMKALVESQPAPEPAPLETPAPPPSADDAPPAGDAAPANEQ